MTKTITILRARGPRLAKLISADGEIVGYDSARTFDLSERAAGSLDDLHGILAALAGQPDQCIVRGAIADPARVRGVRRLLHVHDDGDDKATLRDVPRRWVALDLDSVPAPDGIDRKNMFEFGMFVALLLPREFRGCGFIVQATAQHCIAEGLRLRLWFWLDRPTTGGELKHWFRTVPVYFSAFSAAQVCYTAAPMFESGRDILPQRLVLLPGPPTVRVPPPEALQPPPPPAAKPSPKSKTFAASRYAEAALTNAAARILAAPVGNRHETILSQARGLARLVESGAVSAAHAHAVIEHAAAGAGKTDMREITAMPGRAARHTSGSAAHG